MELLPRYHIEHYSFNELRTCCFRNLHVLKTICFETIPIPEKFLFFMEKITNYGLIQVQNIVNLMSFNYNPY